MLKVRSHSVFTLSATDVVHAITAHLVFVQCFSLDFFQVDFVYLNPCAAGNMTLRNICYYFVTQPGKTSWGLAVELYYVPLLAFPSEKLPDFAHRSSPMPNFLGVQIVWLCVQIVLLVVLQQPSQV